MRFEPALTPNEWAAPWWILGEDGFVDEGLLWWDGVRFVVGYDSGCVSQVVDAAPVQMMAVANAVLPDDSPHKITRGDVEALDFALEHAGDTGDYVRSIADSLRPLRAKLAALLPPE